ncbi:MAG: 5-(carboxyamino)imidazole ribonucleotide synthase, partial [Candidatus Accumulibacter sp.]|nr:5-(carboxyamino)imidazole ribonucleotide synthase [Accumulibacter sp.]
MNNPFLPSADPSTWLGVMGGGQLGRMFTHAAQAMGYKVAVLEPSADCPAGQVADRTVEGGYTNGVALSELAALCSAVTTEFENVPADSLALLAADCFVAPSSLCVQIAQDRILEKKFFVDCAPASNVMPAPHKVIASHADIDAIADDLLPGILKTVRMGYDGKGQVRVRSREDVRVAFDAMGGVACLLEKMLPLAYEVSVLTARGHDGASVVYPIAENVHRDGILFTTTVPGPNVSAACAKQAQDAARAIVAQLGYVGVLCIEFFVLDDGSLVVNEMAPRPHNSGHYTMD